MAIDLQGDLAGMLQGSPGAVLVTLGSASTWGLFDQQTSLQSLGGGHLEVGGQTLSVTIATGSLPAKKGSVLEVGGVPYKVRFPSLLDDGALQVLWLETP